MFKLIKKSHVQFYVGQLHLFKVKLFMVTIIIVSFNKKS